MSNMNCCIVACINGSELRDFVGLSVRAPSGCLVRSRGNVTLFSPARGCGAVGLSSTRRVSAVSVRRN